MTNTVEQAAHSPIGASSCERWWNCPGSVKLSETLPPSEPSPAAAEGTVAHSLGEKTLLSLQQMHREGLPIEEITPDVFDDELGRSYVEDGFEFEVTDEMAEAVQVYVETVHQYIREYGLQWHLNLRTEVRFDLTHIDPEAFGTCDAVIIAPMNRIIIIDYKHGKGVSVEVENNHQLQYYALGAYYGLSEQERSDIKYVEMVVVQPRARHLDGPVRRFTYDVGSLLEFEVQLKRALSRVRSGDPTLQGGGWCKFCNAKPVCPETRRTIEHAASLAFSAIETEPLKPPEPASLTPERISMLVSNANILQGWIKSVIALGTVVADSGVELPDYKLVTKYGRRRWKSEKEVEAAFGLDFDEKIYTKKLKSPAQLEKVVGKARKEELEQYWEIPITGKTLVPKDDPREEVSADSAENVFGGWV